MYIPSTLVGKRWPLNGKLTTIMILIIFVQATFAIPLNNTNLPQKIETTTEPDIPLNFTAIAMFKVIYFHIEKKLENVMNCMQNNTELISICGELKQYMEMRQSLSNYVIQSEINAAGTATVQNYMEVLENTQWYITQLEDLFCTPKNASSEAVYPVEEGTIRYFKSFTNEIYLSLLLRRNITEKQGPENQFMVKVAEYKYKMYSLYSNAQVRNKLEKMSKCQLGKYFEHLMDIYKSLEEERKKLNGVQNEDHGFKSILVNFFVKIHNFLSS